MEVGIIHRTAVIFQCALVARFRCIWMTVAAVIFCLSGVTHADVAIKSTVPSSIPELFHSMMQLPPDERRKVAGEWREIATTRLTANPEDLDAKKLTAVAYGVLGKRATRGEALKEKFATTSRKLLDELVGLEPHDPWVKVLDGLWHLEVSRRGGMMAGFMLGASTRKGNEILDSAMEMGRDPLIAYLHATSLYAYGDSLSHKEAGDALAKGKILLSEEPASEALQELYEKVDMLLAAGDVDALTDFAQSQ